MRSLKSVSHLLRLFKISFTLARHDALFLLEKLEILPFVTYSTKLFRKKHKKDKFDTLSHYHGHCLREALIDLGPSFVKLGQILSVRSDIVGDEIAGELSKLQDRMPGFEFAEVERKIEKNFRKKIPDLYKEFEEKPVAAASIAQVHKATLHTGETVAVKILRPDIKEKFRRDLDLLKWLVGIVDKQLPQYHWMRLQETVETIEDILFREVDMKLEAAAAEELADNFADDPYYRPPTIYWDYTAPEILTMEWVDGVSIGDKQGMLDAGLDPNEILKRSAESFFYQVYRDGYFHADMHGGNAFVTKEGVIIPVDFGVMGRVDRPLRLFLAETLLGLLEGDYRRVAEVHVRAGYVPRDISIDEFAQACRAAGTTVYEKSTGEISYGELLGQMIKVTERYKLQVPMQILLLQKTMIMAEGMGNILDAKINMWELARPLIQEWWKKYMSIEAKALRRIYEAYEDAKKIPLLVDSVREFGQLITNDGFKVKAVSEPSQDRNGSSIWMYLSIFLLGLLVAKYLL